MGEGGFAGHTKNQASTLCTVGVHLNEERGHGVGALDLVDTQYYCEQELSLWWTPTTGTTEFWVSTKILAPAPLPRSSFK